MPKHLKPYMKLGQNKSILYCLLFWGLSLFTSLQAQDTNRQSPFFIDGEAGLMIADDFMGQAALGSGYRLTDTHGVGLEFRMSGTSSCCNTYGMQGIGGLYRFTYKRIYGKLSFGKVISANRSWDHNDQLHYLKGGQYLSLTAGYRFQSGIMFGLGFTHSSSINFNYFVQDFQSDELVFDRIEKVNFPAFTVMIGYLWPGR